MRSVIYETKGRAREFCELAINLYTGCGHRCIYCYGPDVTHQDRAKWEKEPKARLTPGDIQRSAAIYGAKGETRPILLCFVTDPYQPIEEDTRLTRSAIEILNHYGLRVTILSKGGDRAMRDFDLLKLPVFSLPKLSKRQVKGENAFATTLTLLDEEESKKWEPGAAPPHQRLFSLQKAHSLGIETWASLEPVIDTYAVRKLILASKDFVGHYKVGTMNYHEHGKTINWKEFGWNIRDFMNDQGVRYYLKKDLRLAMGYTGPGWSDIAKRG